MPRLARLGASLLFGKAMLANSAGTFSATSCSSFRKDSQRGCGSSMIEICTWSSSGSRRPLNSAAIFASLASPGGGDSSYSTSR